MITSYEKRYSEIPVNPIFNFVQFSINPTKNQILAPKRGSPKPRAELTPPSHPKKLPSPSGHLPRCDPKNHGRRRMCFDVLFNYTLQPMSTLRADLTQHLIISTNKCICTCFECNKLPWWLSSQSGKILNTYILTSEVQQKSIRGSKLIYFVHNKELFIFSQYIHLSCWRLLFLKYINLLKYIQMYVWMSVKNSSDSE